MNNNKNNISFLLFIISLLFFIIDFKFNIFNNIKKINMIKLLNFKFIIYKNINNLFNKIIKEKYIKKIKNKNFFLNVELLKNNIKLNALEFYINENKNLKKILNLKINYKKYNMIISKIIFLDNENLFILINKGQNDNINIGQYAINSKGLIGKIIYSNKENSLIHTIINNNYYIYTKLLKNNYIYLLNGLGKKFLKIKNNLSNNINKIKKNDILLSYNTENKYPENYPVAIIYKIINKNKIILKPLFIKDNTEYIAIIN
ncbi:rod shape-determining protein MreC [Candidatus Nardonella dryophthoridicola]|uniref:Cell shape-determining protein MreC n=1 Tax=endosymbiont of Metamasius hemipterus TaxID=204627 RepID=A0ABT0TWB0_9GAMM|nr:rod shape-determining protein MreC [Candidatus Nardonella dryophthoridicola]MCM0158214.1 hypothetical protein [endosymbiont of Metamasius hemipterus]